MQDAGKVIGGIIVFLALLSIPIWVTQAAGNANEVANPVVDPEVVNDFMAENYPDDVADYESFIESNENYDGCIESTDYMRLNHMKLLMNWRQWSVRDDTKGDLGVSTYTSEETGIEWFMSLTETCLGCHNDRDIFCNQCHEYTATQLGCFECHVEPEGN